MLIYKLTLSNLFYYNRIISIKMHTIGTKIAVTTYFLITGLCFWKFHIFIFQFSIELVFRHHAKLSGKSWSGSFDTWLLLFKACNWGQNTFFLKMGLFMVPCHHIIWLLCPLVPRTYSRTTLCAILSTLFALSSHSKS